jgi:hypothetical protein
MNPVYIQIDKVGNKFYHKDKEMVILHREDGPAVEWSSDKEWWINGVCLTEEEFEKRTAKEIVLTFDEIAAKFGVDVSKLKIAK